MTYCYPATRGNESGISCNARAADVGADAAQWQTEAGRWLSAAALAAVTVSPPRRLVAFSSHGNHLWPLDRLTVSSSLR